MVTFTNFRHPSLSPLSSADLCRMASGVPASGLQGILQELVIGRVEQEEPRWVGISVNYLSQALPAMAVVGILRRACPGLKIVMGGSLISAWGRRIIDAEELAALAVQWIFGPGEVPLARLLGSEAPFRPRGPYPPDYREIPWTLYVSPEPVVPLAAARGCYWAKCRFCPESVSGAPYEPAPLENLARVMEEALRDTGSRWIHFTDSALSPNALKGLAAARTGGRWYGFVRFESLLKDRRFVRDLRRSGCRMLQLGLESGSQRMLDAMRKGIRIPDVSRILRVLHGEGIGTYVYVMFGMPGEDLEAARQTLDLVVKHADCIDYLHGSIMNLPQGGASLEDVAPLPFPGRPKDLSLYSDFCSPRGMDRKGARRFLEREFYRHPVVRRIRHRTPPVFTSSHAPFFLPHPGLRQNPQPPKLGDVSERTFCNLRGPVSAMRSVPEGANSRALRPFWADLREFERSKP